MGKGILDWRTLIGLGGIPDPNKGTTGMGPDMPQAAGDRERGRFRPSQYPRLTQVAVANDDGGQITGETDQTLREILGELRTANRHTRLLLAKFGVSLNE